MNGTESNSSFAPSDNSTLMSLQSNASWDMIASTTTSGTSGYLQGAGITSTTLVEILMTTNATAGLNNPGKSGISMLEIIAFAVSGGVAGLLLLVWCYFFGFRKYWLHRTPENRKEQGGGDASEEEVAGVARETAREMAEDELNICSSPAQAIKIGETPRGDLWKNSSTPNDLKDAMKLRREDDNESRVSVASAAHSLLPEMMETNSSTRMPWTEMSARKMDPEEDKRRLGEPEEKGGKEEARMKLSPFAKLWHKGGGSEEEEMENGNGGQGEKERVTSGGISARLQVDAAHAQQRMSDSIGGLMDWLGSTVSLPCSGGRTKLTGMEKRPEDEWEEDAHKR
mmetsp:Transcript_12309/g.28433  ORF Transcript_12309/g.28433 Transcript_12309/m.28433 type:complete len:341 (-) Transcript_12309:20-1042(-)